MRIDAEGLLAALVVLGVIDVMLALRLVVNKAKANVAADRYAATLGGLDQAIVVGSEDGIGVERSSPRFGDLTRDIQGLHASSPLERIRSAASLGTSKSHVAREALEKAISTERHLPARLYMANALSDLGDGRSVPALAGSLIGEPAFYRTRVNMLIAGFGAKLRPYLAALMERDEVEIQELAVDVASEYVCEESRQWLFSIIDEGSAKMASRAAEVAAQYYSADLSIDRYLTNKNVAIRNSAVRALANTGTRANFLRLESMLADEAVAESALWAISELMKTDSSYVNLAVSLFGQEKDERAKMRLAGALSHRLEYFMGKVATPGGKDAASVIKQVLMMGKTSEFIGFLNRNRDLEIENSLLAIARDAARPYSILEQDLCSYLDERLLRKIGLRRRAAVPRKTLPAKDRALTAWLTGIAIVAVVLFPAVYIVRHIDVLRVWPLRQHIRAFLIDSTLYLAFYAGTVNTLYLTLLILSKINASRQALLWQSKSMSMLFKKRMLPGVSMIAPAYNEEKVIIESVNSLINMKYPDYDLVVVNDGSSDNTLGALIDYYGLYRVDYEVPKGLRTKPIRGVYVNPSFPRLTVVDKENGGKADSLNAGIGVARKEYVCCIDADSLLEGDALLKLASQILDESRETPALGGNVLPVNGCRVDKGFIEEKRIPSNHLARFQTIEYIRSFMGGRLGWAHIDSLLIISGAFGLFRRERVIEAGGYLTINEKYSTHTVGEDMELVVRIGRMMREKGHPHKINYSFNANCWTEVPQDLSSLKRQRFRWHRGLIETLRFHRDVLFNPKYGRKGFISIPYFFLFEMVGPLFELQGFAWVVLAFLLGALNPTVALLLFVNSVMLGILVSIASLNIAESGSNSYPYEDALKLALYSVLENFGLRQFVSMWRTLAYFQMFAGPQGWGQQSRKGFVTNAR